MVMAASEAARSNPLPPARHPHHHAHAPESSLLPTSREVGVAIPDPDTREISVKGRNPVAKSWAHFVAGGCVNSFSMMSPSMLTFLRNGC